MARIKNLSGADYWLKARTPATPASSPGSTTATTTNSTTNSTTANPTATKTATSAADAYDQRLDPAMRAALTVDVPLAPRADLRLLFVDTELLQSLGMPVGKNGYLRPADEAAVSALTSLTPAPRAEATTTGVATRYADKVDRVEDGKAVVGWVRGDGRAVVIGTPQVERTVKNGVAVERPVNLRLKGVATGLQPRGKDDKLHTTGRLADDQALGDTLISSFFAKNGVRTNRTLAFTGSSTLFDYQINGKTYQSTEGTMLLAGQFDRIAHLLEAKNTSGSGAVAKMLEDVNAQLCLELGRGEPLSLPAMYGLIVSRKAREVADLWWLRSYQGSVTYDNIGIFESIDHGTSESLDRTHQKHAFNPGCSVGFGKEPAFVLEQYVATELKSFFSSAAGLVDKGRFQMLDARALVQQEMATRMAENALEHSGFDVDSVAGLLTHARPEAIELAATVQSLADVVVTGAVHTVQSRFNAGWKTDVKDPARYDVMAALAALPGAIQLARAGDDAGAVAALVTGLASLRPEKTLDDAAARRLLQAARPLFDRVLAGATPAVAKAHLDISADVARRINAPVDGLMRFSVLPWVNDKLAEVKDGRLSITRFRGEVNALVRSHQRRGDDNPGHVAAALRHDQLPQDALGRRTLSSVVENAVRIEERSDGVSDALVCGLAENPMQLADPSRVKLELTFDDGTTRTVSPTPTPASTSSASSSASSGGDEVVFDVPLKTLPQGLTARFVADDGSGKVWDLDGLGFGAGHALVLNSAVVAAELGALAAKAGRRRHHADPNQTAAALRLQTAVIAGPAVSAGDAAAFAARRTDAGGAPAIGAAFTMASGGLAVPVQRNGWQGGDVVVLARGPGAAAYIVPPEVLDVAEAHGRRLGRPVDDAHKDGLGRLVQLFEGGRVLIDAIGAAEVQFSNKATSAVSFDTDAAFAAVVAGESVLQQPVGPAFRSGAWQGQRFAAHPSSWGDGWLFRRDDGAEHRIVRGFAMFYPTSKALLGAPLGDEQPDPDVNDGVLQRFERGVMKWDPRNDVRVKVA